MNGVHILLTIGSIVEEIVINYTYFLTGILVAKKLFLLPGTLTILTQVCNTCGQYRQRIPVAREECYKMLAHKNLRKVGLSIFANKNVLKNE
jgi:hypothetical protein